MKTREAHYQESTDVVKDANGNLEVAQRNGQGGVNKAVLENLDNGMAAYLLGMDLGEAANTLAYKDFEYSMKADPYSLEGYKQSNRVALENLRTYNDMLVEKYKFDLEAAGKAVEAKGSPLENMPAVKKVLNED